MANDIKFESFAIYVFIKQAEGEPETLAETVRGEDTVAVIFPRKGRGRARGKRGFLLQRVHCYVLQRKLILERTFYCASF